MLGVALEGGGARGAFHVGAIKALLEEGYEIDGIVGTSIGVSSTDFNSESSTLSCPSMVLAIEKIFQKNLKNLLTNTSKCAIIKTPREGKQPERKGAHESK